MTDLLSVTPLGLAAFVSATNPTDSEVGAKLNDLFVNSASGDHFVCIADTFGSQQWQRTSDGVVFPIAILQSDHPDLITMYTMDNISGSTIVDESGNGNNATNTSGVTQAGQVGNEMYFGGFAFADMGNPGLLPLTGNFSLCLWLTMDTPTGNNYFFNQYISGPSDRTIIEYNDSAPGALALVCGLNVASRTVSLSSATRYCIIIQRNGENVEFSVDGDTFTSDSFSSGITLGNYGGLLGKLSVGASYNSGGADLRGEYVAIDQLRLFNRALTQAEAVSIANEV